MKNEKEKWIEEVFDSATGSRRAKPSEDLFAKIERQIDIPNAKIIPLGQWRVAVAAAVVILILNIFAISQFNKGYESSTSELANDPSSESLISNYKLYE